MHYQILQIGSLLTPLWIILTLSLKLDNYKHYIAIFILSVNFSGYYIQTNFRILQFYVCLVVLNEIICLQFFICILLSVPLLDVYVSLASASPLWRSNTQTSSLHATEPPTLCTSGACDQGSGAGTKISGSYSGSRSRHLKVLAAAPEWFGQLKTSNWKLLYYLYSSLAPQTKLWNRNRNFRLRLRPHHLKVFGSGSCSSHILNCLGSGSTALNLWPDLTKAGTSGHASFWIFKRLWQTRALENKVAAGEFCAVLSENFCSHKI